MNLDWRQVRFIVQVLVVAVVLATCASPAPAPVPPPPPPPPTPTVVQATIEVRPSTNPDARGRPSPVVLRFYELKALGAFGSADFFSLFEKDKAILATELVAREEFQLLPGDNRQFERKLQPETRFIAVVAAFRDIERGQWRASMPVVAQQTTPVLIRLEASSVSISGR